MKWLKANWKKSIVLLTIGYFVHIFIEAFIITNALAIIGLKIPVIIPV